MNYTEENQKAEFIGGAIATGCALVFVGAIVLFVLIAVLTQ